MAQVGAALMTTAQVGAALVKTALLKIDLLQVAHFQEVGFSLDSFTFAPSSL
jgi:hypothetical protein